MPGFNIKGKETIKTDLGSILTLLSTMVVLIYAISKSSHIRSISGQTISMYFEENDHITSDNQLNLNDRNFRIAFAFEDKNGLLTNTSYIRWIFRIHRKKD